jgi:hypothetical protein
MILMITLGIVRRGRDGVNRRGMENGLFGNKQAVSKPDCGLRDGSIKR